MRQCLVAVAVSLLLVGCGDGNTVRGTRGGGTVSVSIVAPQGLLHLGETYVFGMNARNSDGVAVTTGGTWGSDASSVATIEAATGRLQVVGIGEATIFVDFQGVRGTLRIRTTVNYAGTLNGAFRVTGCSQTGALAAEDVCSEAPNGTVFGVMGTFTQTGDSVTATMDLIEFPAEPVAVTVNSAGELRFQSEHRDDPLIATVEWVLRPSGLRQVQGTIVIRFRVIGASGTVTMRGEILPQSIARFDAAPDASSPLRTLRDLASLERARTSR